MAMNYLARQLAIIAVIAVVTVAGFAIWFGIAWSRGEGSRGKAVRICAPGRSTLAINRRCSPSRRRLSGTILKPSGPRRRMFRICKRPGGTADPAPLCRFAYLPP